MLSHGLVRAKVTQTYFSSYILLFICTSQLRADRRLWTNSLSLSHCVVWVQIYFCYFAATIVGTSAEKRFGRRIVAAAVAAVDPSSTNDDKDGDERLCIELSPSMRCCPFHIYYYYIDSVAHMRLHFCCYCCCCCEMCRRFGSYFSHGRWCNCNCMWYQWYLHKVHHSRPTKT